MLFGEFATTHFIRYFYWWAFGLRRVLIAVIILNMQGSTIWTLNLLVLVNGLALVYTGISRPFKETLLNVHTLISDIGVMVVLGELYVFRYPFLTDQ